MMQKVRGDIPAFLGLILVYFISFSAFPCGTISIALRCSFSVAHTRVVKWFVVRIYVFRGYNCCVVVFRV